MKYSDLKMKNVMKRKMKNHQNKLKIMNIDINKKMKQSQLEKKIRKKSKKYSNEKIIMNAELMK